MKTWWHSGKLFFIIVLGVSKYCVNFYKGELNNNAYVQRIIFIQITVKLDNRLLNEVLSST